MASYTAYSCLVLWLALTTSIPRSSATDENNRPDYTRTALKPTTDMETDWGSTVSKMLTNTGQPQIFPTPPQRSYFAKVGYVEPTRDWLHLHMTYNLSSLFVYASTPCRCVNAIDNFVNKDGFDDPRHYRINVLLWHKKRAFEEQCEIAKNRTNIIKNLLDHATLYSNAPGPSDREKRVIPALLWTAASAAVATSKTSLAKFILSKVTQGSFIFNIASTLLSIVSLGSYLIMGRGSDYYSKLHDWDTFDMEGQTSLCQIDSDRMFRYLDNFDSALVNLLQHTYPARFIHPAEILKELPELSQTLSDKGIRLLLDNPADIASLPSSFVVSENVIHIFIHVPISHAPQLTAYRYIPTPTIQPRENTTELATIIHDNTILALTNDMTTFVELKDLSACSELQSTRFLCPNTPVLNHNAKTSCLMSLFTSDTESTYQCCTLHEFHRKYFAAELAPTKFYLYTQQPEQAEIRCASPTRLRLDQPFQSTRHTDLQRQKVLPLHYSSSVIELPAHCHLKVFNLSLYPASTHKTDVVLSKSAFTHDKQKFFQLVRVHDADKNTLKTPRPRMSRLDKFKQYMPYLMAASALVTILILLLCLVSIPTFCVKRRNGRFYIKQPLRSILLFLHSSPDPTPPARTHTTESAPPPTDSHENAPPERLPTVTFTAPTPTATPASTRRRLPTMSSLPQLPQKTVGSTQTDTPTTDKSVQSATYPIIPAAGGVVERI